tara:strand:- start:152 stop:274 length:123 start_codon:yes stop_codon:yes gene_type:complete
MPEAAVGHLYLEVDQVGLAVVGLELLLHQLEEHPWQVLRA